MEHTHLRFMEPGHHSPLHFEGFALIEQRQSGQVPRQEPKVSLQGSSDWLSSVLARIVLECVKQAQVVERSLGGLRGFIQGSREKQRREERHREKGLGMLGCHVDVGLDLGLEEEELEGV